MFGKHYARKHLLQDILDEISNILCNGIVDRCFFSIIINYDDLVSILVSIFQIIVEDTHMNRLFNPLSDYQVFNIIKKMVFLSILSIPFATIMCNTPQDQKGQTEFNEQAKEKFDAIRRCKKLYTEYNREPYEYLKRALLKEDMECVKILIDDKDNTSSLRLAVVRGSIDEVKTLIDKGADINGRNKDYTTPLFYTVYCENPSKCEEMVKLFRDHGANMRAADVNGDTLIHWLSRTNNMHPCLETMIECGVNPWPANNKGESPLHSASYSTPGSPETVKAINDTGGTTYIIDQDNEMQTALHLAAKHGNVQTVKALLDECDAGWGIFTKDCKSRTPKDMLDDNTVIRNKKADDEIRSMLEREEIERRETGDTHTKA